MTPCCVQCPGACGQLCAVIWRQTSWWIVAETQALGIALQTTQAEVANVAHSWRCSSGNAAWRLPPTFIPHMFQCTRDGLCSLAEPPGWLLGAAGWSVGCLWGFAAPTAPQTCSQASPSHSGCIPASLEEAQMPGSVLSGGSSKIPGSSGRAWTQPRMVSPQPWGSESPFSLSPALVMRGEAISSWSLAQLQAAKQKLSLKNMKPLPFVLAAPREVFQMCGLCRLAADAKRCTVLRPGWGRGLPLHTVSNAPVGRRIRNTQAPWMETRWDGIAGLSPPKPE